MKIIRFLSKVSGAIKPHGAEFVKLVRCDQAAFIKIQEMQTFLATYETKFLILLACLRSHRVLSLPR